MGRDGAASRCCGAPCPASLLSIWAGGHWGPCPGLGRGSGSDGRLRCRQPLQKAGTGAKDQRRANNLVF